MKNYLDSLDKDILAKVKKIGQEADARGLRAHLVGGIVRDIVLKKKNLDLDIVIEGDAIGLARHLAKVFHVDVKAYPEFGTATLFFPGNRLDLVTARREDYLYSGALPVVASGALQDDLRRRDFTINAMAISLNQDSFGVLVDYFGGWEDLKAKKIRVLHDQSFLDDPTRLLRAIRFEQRLGFHVEPRTLSLLKAAVEERSYQNVKPPRYFAEFKKMLNEEDPVKPLKRLYQLKGLEFLEVPLRIDWKVLVQLRSKMDEKKLGEFGCPPWLIYLMGLMENVSDPLRERVSQRFQLTKEERVSLSQVKQALEALRLLSSGAWQPSRVYRLLEHFPLTVVLFMEMRATPRSARRRVHRYLVRDRQVKVHIDGERLRSLGFVPSRRLGEVLEEVLYQKIDGRIKTGRQELTLAKQLHEGRER